jgi:hypothetical protein
MREGGVRIWMRVGVRVWSYIMTPFLTPIGHLTSFPPNQEQGAGDRVLQASTGEDAAVVERGIAKTEDDKAQSAAPSASSAAE